jgi:hypothetical protein
MSNCLSLQLAERKENSNSPFDQKVQTRRACRNRQLGPRGAYYKLAPSLTALSSTTPEARANLQGELPRETDGGSKSGAASSRVEDSESYPRPVDCCD